MNQLDPTRHYLNHIGRVPLLTPEEEVRYTKQVAQMMQLQEKKQILAETIGRKPSIQEWANYVQLESADLIHKIAEGERAKQKVIHANLRLVVTIAKKYQHRGMELLDMIQEGSLGLIRAVELFDPTKGYRFSTYAYWWVRQGVTRAIADQGRTVRLPVHISEKISKVNIAQRELSQQLGRTPTIPELASKAGLNPDSLRELLAASQQTTSINVKVGLDKDCELCELITSDIVSPEDYTEREINKEQLRLVLGQLPEREQQVISLKLGLSDGRPHSLREISDQLDLSRESIRKSQKRALAVLQEHCKLMEINSAHDLYSLLLRA